MTLVRVIEGRHIEPKVALSTRSPLKRTMTQTMKVNLTTSKVLWRLPRVVAGEAPLPLEVGGNVASHEVVDTDCQSLHIAWHVSCN